MHALGDVTTTGYELTPVAIAAGRLLSDRLFAGKKKLMDYVNVPTTVFTPLEYGAVGLSEEDAVAKFGSPDEGKLNIYHTYFQPLEWRCNGDRPKDACYIKLICDPAQGEKVVGAHLLGQ